MPLRDTPESKSASGNVRIRPTFLTSTCQGQGSQIGVLLMECFQCSPFLNLSLSQILKVGHKQVL